MYIEAGLIPPTALETSKQVATALHILLVSEASLEHTSGVTNSVKQVTEQLVTGGHQVSIICPHPAPSSFVGAEIMTTKSINLKGFDVGHKTVKRFRQVMNDVGPDVLHAAAPMQVPKGVLFLGGNAIKAACKLEVPAVAVYQTDAVRFAGFLGLGLTAPVIEKQLRKMHNRAQLNLVPSEASRQDLLHWGVRADTIRPWGRGVDTSLFRSNRKTTPEVMELRDRWAPNGEVIVGVVSRLEPEKSLHKLGVLNDISGLRLVVVGDGTEKAALHKALPNAHFTGRLGGEELANAYAALDIFAFPSTVDTFAQVIQEAHASGVPVVAANRGGPRDLVLHGVNGFLYEPAEKHAADTELRQYVMQLAEDHALRTVMAEKAEAFVAGKSWAVLTHQILDYYYEALQIQKVPADAATVSS
jgi:phosphatidylinositol alpha 1,6-mannosyltransferase